MSRRGSLAVALLGALVLLGGAAPTEPQRTAHDTSLPPIGDEAHQGWVGSWSTSPVREADSTWRLRNQSLRMVAHLSVGGSNLRVRLSNAYGSAPVTFTHVRVARRVSGPAVDPATDRQVLFSGAPQVTVPAGREVVSDPVQLDVRPGTDVAVSIHVPATPGGATRHPMALATQYSSQVGAGDVTSDGSGVAFNQTMSTTYFLTGIDVRGEDAHSAVVALGDSITDGASSIPDTNGRWPDVLAAELAKRGVGVLNAGISANSVTSQGERPHGGEAAVRRFSRDVLGQAGVRSVVLFEGTNDLSAGVSGGQVAEGLRVLAQRARRAGLTVVGATVPPRACGDAWSGQEEDHRRFLNHWIRTSADFHAVADVDAALRDQTKPTCLDPRYDSGDGLHPNQLGMRRIAEAMPVDALSGR